MNYRANILKLAGLLLVAIVLAACGTVTPSEVPGDEGRADIRQATLLLPGHTEERLVSYEVIDCLALFEGDIILGDVCGEGGLQPQAVAIEGGSFRWPNRTVPFEIDSSLNATMQQRVQNAIDHWEANTDMVFVPRSSHSDFIDFVSSRSSCASNVGRISGRQTIVLATGCTTGSIIHEIGHAVGLYHEQSRSDRDDHVTILWDNIIDGKDGNFEIADDGVDMGAYDFGSIMHYGAFDFCIRNRANACIGRTIETIPAGTAIGQRTGLSDGDIAAVARLYPTEAMGWHQNSSGIGESSESSDRFGQAVAVGDFDNDGFMDVAVGVPNESVGGIGGAGAVNVLYGGGNGLSGSGDQLWHQNSSGISGSAEGGDRFGAALAAGDFNNDGFDDLAIGVPGEAIGFLSGAGMVNVLYGSGSGLSGSGDQGWHQDVSGVNGSAEIDDQFGAALAVGDFNNDGRDDLAIGVPGEAIGFLSGAGMVNVLYGSSSKLTSSGDQSWHQNTSGVNGSAEIGDRFGAALAAGDFNNDGRDDLAIGVPGEAIGSLLGAGSVNVLYGSSSKLTSSGDQSWHQNTSGVNGSAEIGDQFGAALAVGDFDNDGRDDLAIGVPGEAIGSLVGAGSVNVLYGSSSKLTSSGDQSWHQNTSGVNGSAEIGDQFGAALAVGDFDNDGRDDLAIGVPGESIGSRLGAGAVNVLFGRNGNGLSSSGDQLWHQNYVDPASVAVAGAAESGDLFGAALATGDFNGDGLDDLAVGVPGEAIGSIGNSGMVNTVYYFTH